MANSVSDIYMHITFTTKRREDLLYDNDMLKIVIDHIIINAVKKAINIDTINGFENHIHILIRIPRTIAISKVVQLIKGESSHWIRKYVGDMASFQ